MIEARVCHRRADQAQDLKAFEVFEPFQARIRDLGVNQVELLKILEAFDVFEPGVGDRGVVDRKTLELGEVFQLRQAVVAHLGEREVDVDDRLCRVFCVTLDLAADLLDLRDGFFLVVLLVRASAALPAASDMQRAMAASRPVLASSVCVRQRRG